MSDLENQTFRNTEHKPEYEQYYSFFLNTLLKAKKDQGYTSTYLAKVFKCSKGTISHFENRIKDHDFVMLFKYAGFLKHKITMYLDKMTYVEIMDK